MSNYVTHSPWPLKQPFPASVKEPTKREMFCFAASEHDYEAMLKFVDYGDSDPAKVLGTLLLTQVGDIPLLNMMEQHSAGQLTQSQTPLCWDWNLDTPIQVT